MMYLLLCSMRKVSFPLLIPKIFRLRKEVGEERPADSVEIPSGGNVNLLTLKSNSDMFQSGIDNLYEIQDSNFQKIICYCKRYS